jgi:hypothetical protein
LRELSENRALRSLLVTKRQEGAEIEEVYDQKSY